MMGWRRTAALSGVAGAAMLALGAAPPRGAHRAAGEAPASAQVVTGPVATYWVSAATSTGFGAGLMGGGGRPSMGSVMGMMMRGGPDPNAVSRSLTLQLGSTDRPQGEPKADHYVPQGLGVGQSLPLTTPRPTEASAPSQSSEPGDPESYKRPEGRILIYWGCGEHAGPGQPVVFDFASLSKGAPLPDLGGTVHVNVERPPSFATSTTYGHYPNERRTPPIPAMGSLVGSHAVKSTYAPDIAFDVDPRLDFMPGLQLQVAGPSVEGGKRLTWTPAPTATGYYLQLMGAQGGERGGRGDPSGGGGATLVFWSSSAVKPGFFGGGLADYLPPAEVQRLVAQRAVLPPQAGECVVPAEVAQAAPMGLVTEIAYGPEQVFADPPRPPRGPWNIRWRAKVRVKSTATLLLGMPGGMGGRDRPAPPSRGDVTRNVLKGLIPHPF